MSYFHQLQVYVNFRNEKILHWDMEGTSFKPTASVQFYVDKAREAGEWQEIGGPITDDCYYTDTVKWNWGKDKDTYYRVRFKDSSGSWVYSKPTAAYEGWSPSDYRIAREICRKEYLNMRQGGRQGVLLSRKEWGRPCPSCRDWDLRDVVDTGCTICFGVGIVGGYYAPLDMPAIFQPYAVKRDISANGTGVQQQTQSIARIVLYPWVKAYDLWMDARTGDRFTIQTINVVADMKGVPLIGVVSLRKLPRTDVAHSAKMNIKADTPPAASPSGSGTEHTWGRGLDCKDDY